MRYDVTIPIRAGMPVFPGDPTVHLDRVASIAAGGVCNLSRLDFGVHSGTHIDAPVHFIDGAPAIESTPLDALLGPALVVDATGVSGNLTAEAVERLTIPSGTIRLLFKTPNSALWDLPAFSDRFIGLTADAADLLVRRGVQLVGIDYLSIAPFGDPAPTHIALLKANVVIVEGLDLRRIAPGAYHLTCLPTLIPGSDGAPARTILEG